MWQSAATDSIVPLGELWKGSVLQQYDVPSSVMAGVHGGEYFVWAILFLIFSGLLFREPLSVFFSWAGGFLKYPARRTYYDTSAGVRYGLPASMVFMLPVSAFLVYGTQAVPAGYPAVLAVVVSFTAFRFAVTSGISYVSGQKEFISSANRLFCVFFIMAVMIFCIVYMVGLFIPGIFPILKEDVVPVMLALLVILYIFEHLRIIFSFKEPVLLSILYLCTLEILPIAIAVATILKF